MGDPISMIAGPLLGPVVGEVMGPILGDIGSALGLGGKGGAGGGIGDILKDVMQAFQGLEKGLQGMLPQFPQLPNPFNIAQQDNPLKSIFGGSGGIGGGGGGRDFGGSLNVGGENFSQLMGDVKSAAASGDPGQIFAAQQKMDQYTEMMNMLTSMEKAMHDLISNIARNIA